MKPKTKIVQSSRAVQHTPSGDQQQQQPGPEQTAPAAQTRLPVDFEKRAQNRALNTDTVLNLLAGALPDFVSKAFTVGGWVWIAFDTAPAPEVRQQLSQIGFHWNSKRQLWQHPCGKFTYGSKADPRDTYTTKPAMEAYAS
jgi:hypothetical protein